MGYFNGLFFNCYFVRILSSCVIVNNLIFISVLFVKFSSQAAFCGNVLHYKQQPFGKSFSEKLTRDIDHKMSVVVSLS